MFGASEGESRLRRRSSWIVNEGEVQQAAHFAFGGDGSRLRLGGIDGVPQVGAADDGVFAPLPRPARQPLGGRQTPASARDDVDPHYKPRGGHTDSNPFRCACCIPHCLWQSRCQHRHAQDQHVRRLAWCEADKNRAKVTQWDAEIVQLPGALLAADNFSRS